MAISVVTLDTKFTQWKDITNLIITALGDNTALTTTEKASLVGAVNELVTNGGDLTSLTTTEQGSLVGAINELLVKIGTIASLSTTVKTSTVAAVNELDGEMGDLANLTTDTVLSIVAAINELVTSDGDLTSLTTTEDGSLVGAINELDADVGDLTTLTTTAQGSAVASINELDGDIGTLTSLTTTAQGSAVAAINEVDANVVLVSGIQFINLEPMGGRFASDDMTTIAVATFTIANTVIQAHNSASIVEGDNFINDNANFGGGGGTLGTDISQLVNILDSTGGRTQKRYGYEFYIADITADANTADGQTYSVNSEDYYPIVQNSNIFLGPIGRTVTWMGWVRAKTVNDAGTYSGIILGDSDTVTYIDGVVSDEQTLLTVADNWVHVRQTVDLDSEFHNLFPAIYANNLDNVQIALSGLFIGDVDWGMHTGLV